MTRLISFFGSRVAKTIRPWPPSTKLAVRRYLHLTNETVHSAERLNARKTDQPYWILLPFWLAERFRGGKKKAYSRRFMDDILWAQYCLFVFIRMQDDLFDRHTKHFSLIYAADGFLLEAHRVFSGYFPKRSPFWRIFSTCIGETIFAVANADDLQSRAKRSNNQLLRCYGRTSAICNVAAVAVGLKAEKMKMISRIKRFSNEMMIAGAIHDDILDMKEDLKRGRFNYAASFFLPPHILETARKVETVKRLRSNLLNGSGLSRLFTEIHKHARRADDAYRPLAVPAATEYISTYRRSMKNMEDIMRLQSADRIFEKDIR